MSGMRLLGPFQATVLAIAFPPFLPTAAAALPIMRREQSGLWRRRFTWIVNVGGVSAPSVGAGTTSALISVPQVTLLRHLPFFDPPLLDVFNRGLCIACELPLCQLKPWRSDVVANEIASLSLRPSAQLKAAGATTSLHYPTKRLRLVNTHNNRLALKCRIWRCVATSSPGSGTSQWQQTRS